MNLKKLLFTKNDCYKAGKPLAVKGIMIHSTGANNPNLRRYVGPDDGLLGVNTNKNHWNQPTPDNRQVCVHAFIGNLADGSIATYQTLLWDMRGWHGGKGTKGSVNDTHIGFEICEDGLTDAAYFGKVYQEAVELCAYLCKQFKLIPTADGVIIGHFEGYKRGIASNHGDPNNWFPKHRKSMDSFRAAVAAEMAKTSGTAPATPAPSPSGVTIRVKTTRTGGGVKTLNIEEYLRGVVPSEMSASWPLEALKAQAVAARSFALAKIAANKNKDFDVDDTTAYQAYNESKIAARTDEAVKATAGQIVAYGGKLAETFYSASNGGKTYSSREVWGGDRPYLISQADPFDKQTKNGHGVGMSHTGRRGAPTRDKTTRRS